MARPWDCRACSCSDPLTRHTHIYLVKNVYKCFVFWHGHVYFFLIVGLHPWEHICTTVQLCVTHSRFLTRQTLTLSKQLVEVLACVYASVFSSVYSWVRVYYNFWCVFTSTWLLRCVAKCNPVTPNSRKCFFTTTSSGVNMRVSISSRL